MRKIRIVVEVEVEDKDVDLESLYVDVQGIRSMFGHMNKHYDGDIVSVEDITDAEAGTP